MADLNYIDWHVHPFRAERWLEIWRPALDRALAFGAKSCYLTRDVDDPLHFRQVTVWDDHADFERYWYSDEIAGPSRGRPQLLQQAPAAELAHGGGRRGARSKRRSNRLLGVLGRLGLSRGLFRLGLSRGPARVRLSGSPPSEDPPAS